MISCKPLKVFLTSWLLLSQMAGFAIFYHLLQIGEGNGNPHQYSFLENPMGRGVSWATVHGVAGVEHDLVTKPPLAFIARALDLGELLIHGHAISTPAVN